MLRMGISKEGFARQLNRGRTHKLEQDGCCFVGVKSQGDCEMDLFSSVSKESVFNGYGSVL